MVLFAGPESTAAEQAARALANICDNNEENLQQVKEMHGVEALVRVLQVRLHLPIHIDYN